MDKKTIQTAIDDAKPIINMSKEEFDHIQKPVGKATYVHALRESRKIPHKPTDRIECTLCGKTYTRNNQAQHRNTQIHKTYESINKQLLKLMMADKKT